MNAHDNMLDNPSIVMATGLLFGNIETFPSLPFADWLELTFNVSTEAGFRPLTWQILR